MSTKTPITKVLYRRTQKMLWVCLVFVFATVVLGTSLLRPAHAATNSSMNFQARLLQSSGALVNDGYYNVQFKLYNVSSGGSALWTETYYDSNGATAGNDNRIRVANGYLTANLGALTAFPGTIDWDQELWLTMNVGGSTQSPTPTYDGEMNPRLKITAVPYAFKAAQAAAVASAATSTASTNSNSVTIYSGNATGATSNSGNIVIDSGTATGTAGVLQLGNTNASGVTIGRAGITTTLQGAVALSALSATDNSIFLCRNSSNQIAGCNTTGTGAAFIQGGNSYSATAVLGTNDNNQLDFETNNITRWSITTAGILQSNGAQTIQTSTGNLTLATAGGNGNILLSPNGTGKVGIGEPSPGARLQVTNGAAATVGLIVKGAASQTGDLQQWQDSTGAVLAKVNSSGVMSYLSGGTNGSALQPVATQQYVQSRGENLVTNGFGSLKDTTNFSGFAYNNTELFSGFGSFTYDGADTSKNIDELIAVDISDRYRFTYYAKLLSKTVPSETPTHYGMIIAFDADGSLIGSQHVMKYSGSRYTTLALPLNPGDTTVTLTDATGWYNGATTSNKVIGFYPYMNAKGYTYPDYTYTRDTSTFDLWPSGGISGNVITLNAPWAGTAKSAGTKVANSIYGGSYDYIAGVSTTTTDTWSQYDGVIGASGPMAALPVEGGSAVGNEMYSATGGFRWGTSFVKIGWLLSYSTPVGTAKTAINSVSFGLDSSYSDRFIAVQKSATSTANLSEWQSSTGTVLGAVSSAGSLGVGVSTPGAKLHVVTGAAAIIGQIIQGASSQTADLLQFKNSGGTVVSVVDKSGNLGIGTATPISKLTVVSGSTDGLMMTYDSSGNYRNSLSNEFVAGTAASNKLKLNVSDGTVAGQVTAMTLLGNGNVGVGDTTPTNKLDVNGAIGVSDTTFITAARLIQAANGAVDGPAFSFSGDTNTGMYSSGADTLDFATASTSRWAITSVGILQSNGAQTIQTSTGNLTLATAGGNGNVVINANGTGILDVQDNADFAGTLTAGTGNAFTVSATGAIVGVGVNSGAGLLQGIGGLTLNGTTNINTSGANTTNIGTGTNTGAINIGSSTAADITLQSGNGQVELASTAQGFTGTITNSNFVIQMNNATLQNNTTTSQYLFQIDAKLNFSSVASGTNTLNFYGIASNPEITAAIPSGKLATFSGIYSSIENTANAAIANSYGLRVMNGTPGTSIDNRYGVYVQKITGGTLSNYSLLVDNGGINPLLAVETGSSVANNGVIMAQYNTSGTQTNGLLINRSGTGGTTTNLLNLTQTAGVATNALTFSGTFTNLINATNLTVTNAGNADFAGTLTAGTANAFQVNATGAVTAVGVNSGTGLLQGTGGLTVTGATNINATGASTTTIGSAAAGNIFMQSGGTIGLVGTTYLNNDSGASTNINTGTSTGAVNIGSSVASAIALQSGSTIGLVGITSLTGLAAGGSTALTVNAGAATNSGLVVNGGASADLISVNVNAASYASFNIDSNGRSVFRPGGDTTDSFRIQTAGTNATVFGVNTLNSAVNIANLAIGTGSVPATQLEVVGAMRLSGTGTDTFVSPQGANVGTKINIPLFDPGAFGQILSFGLPFGSTSSSRAMSLFDNRAGVHQPTLAVFNPAENTVVGFNWNGSDETANVQTMDVTSNTDTAGITLRSGNTSSGGNTGAVSVVSGNATSGDSGNVTIDVGTASGTAGTVGLGVTSASAITLGRSGINTTNAGALTVSQLLTGSLGATISGAAINLNASSNFVTNINTGTSTGAVTIGNGTSTAGTIALQGGAASSFSATNATGTTKLSFAAPSTAGIVTFRLPAGGTGATTYDICTTFAVCSGYAPSATNGYVQLAPAVVQTDTTNNNSIYINKANGTSGDLLRLQYNGANAFKIASTGTTTIYKGLYLSGTTSGNVNLMIGSVVQNAGTDANQYSLQNQTTFDLINMTDAVSNLYGHLNAQTITNTGVTARSVINAYGLQARSIINNAADVTITSRYALHVDGSTANSGTLANNYGLYINNQSGVTAGTSNYPIYVASATVNQPLFTIASTGATTFRNQTDSTSAFQIQNSTGTNLFKVDTTNSNVALSGSLSTGYISNVKDTETGAATYTESRAGTSYSLRSSTASNSSFATTFNITGLPAVDGTVAIINVGSGKDSTLGSYYHSTIVQINGSTKATVTTSTTNGAQEFERSFIVTRMSGIWTIVGQPATENVPNTAQSATTADFAEWIRYSGETAPRPGELLVVGEDPTSVKISDSPYSNRLIGVVSTDPYQVAGIDDGHSVILALTGRVPLKVSLENGPIEKGDKLTSSSIPGLAMKALKAGTIVGTALSGYDGTQELNTVDVQLRVGYDVPEATTSSLLQGSGLSISGNAIINGNASIGGSLNVTGPTDLSGLTVNGNAIFNGNLTVKNIQVADITVNGHIITVGNTPVVLPGVAAGVEDALNDINAPTVTIDGNDTSGTITVVPGANTKTGDLAQITFDKPFGKAPKITLTPVGSISAELQVYIDSPSGTGFVLGTNTTSQTAKTYTFNYQIMQ